MELGLISNDNIIAYTKDFLEKAKKKLEKPKDEPRYKTIVQYEADFKTNYASGLSKTLNAVFKQYRKELKNVTDAS